MAPESHASGGHASPPRPAVWPWLLVPVVALALFFTLRAVRSTPGPDGSLPTASPEAPAALGAGESMSADSAR